MIATFCNTIVAFLEFTIERSPDNGGNLTITSPSQLSQIFKDQALHPADLKPFVIQRITNFLQPVKSQLEVDDLAGLIKAAFPPAPKGGKKK